MSLLLDSIRSLSARFSGAMDPTPPPARVVVVGAGPAGVLAACFAARLGHEVEVYERMDHPANVSSNTKDRAFVLALNPRGAAALAEAGVDDWRLAGPGSGVVRCEAAIMMTGAGQQITRMAWPGGRLVGDRMSHARQLVAAAERLHPGRISFHRRTPLEGLDLAAKTATVRPEGGAARAVPYDLLVAADGVWSKVRTAAEAQCPELTSAIEPGESSYKVFRSVALPPELALADVRGAHAIRFLRGARGVIFLSPNCGGGASPDPLVGSGALSMPTEDWAALESEEAVAELLRREYPVFGQLAAAKLATSGHRLTASQLHAPGLVLVGDAGHGVTPRTGNGMNAALEDSQLLGLLLAEALADPDPAAALERLPAAFSAARMADAQALLFLDGEFPRRLGVTARPWSLPSLALRVSTLARLLLHRAMCGRVAKPAFMRLQSARVVPYRQIAAQMRRDDWLVGAAAAGAGAAALAGVLTLLMRSR